MREMKDSGVPWIGEIPASWSILRTKALYRSHKRIVGSNAEQYERLALTLGGVIKRSKEDSTGLQPESFDGYQVLQEGELVFKLIDLENLSTSRVGYSPYTGIVSPAYVILHPDKGVNARFGEYYFLSLWQRAIFNSLGDNGVRSNLSSGDLLTIPYPTPPKLEQDRIVSFLDTKCSEIESLLEKTWASIEEYKNLKLSIITEAVTKGIRGERKMKDSGVEWLGKIPQEWQQNRLKVFLSQLTDGTHQTPNYVAEGVPFLSIKDISCGRLDFSNTKFISQDEHELLSKHARVELGDILFTRIGTLGIFVKVDTTTPFDIFVSLGLMKVRQDRINTDYLVYYLSSSSVLNYINNVKAGGGTSAAKFNLADVAKTWILLPSLSEQEEIVTYLDEKCSTIDSLIASKEALIDELEAYKKSLIYEYVTGKKEVPA